MPKLNCNVAECTFNSNELCAKHIIKVDIDEISTKNDTCCASYKEKDIEYDKYMTEFATFEHVNPNVKVDCDSVNCRYNYNKECSAYTVDIKGRHARHFKETCCSTFQSK